MGMTPGEIGKSISSQVEKKKSSSGEADRRATTSKENGMKGGRPFLRPESIADKFLKTGYMEEEQLTLRRYRGMWYKYRAGAWREWANDDVRAAVSGFMQRADIGKIARLSRHTIDDVMAMLDSDCKCALDSHKFNMPCFLPDGETAAGWMPMKNAVINIEEAAAAIGRMEQIPHNAMRQPSPSLFVTYGLDYDFVPGAKCPKFLKYLAEVQPDEENRKSLQMLAGLSLVPDCRYNVAFFLYGEAGTGKSVFVDILMNLVGKKNCCSVPLARFAERFGMAELTTKLLNVVGELPMMPENGKTHAVEGFFKQITAGETIPVELKGVDAYAAPATARMIFATNVMPYFADRSKALFDRIRIIPFNQRIRGTSKQKPDLAAEICADELPGILLWAIEGLAQLRRLTQFPECSDGLRLKEEHLLDCDRERAFLTECVAEERGSSVSTQQLYDKYYDWMTDNGHSGRLAQCNFRKAVQRVFPSAILERQRANNSRVRMWRNIKLINDY